MCRMLMQTGSDCDVSHMQGGKALPLVRLRCVDCPVHSIHAAGKLM